jgi:hypothetical protein
LTIVLKEEEREREVGHQKYRRFGSLIGEIGIGKKA